MDWYPLLRPLLFRLDPEVAHTLALSTLRVLGPLLGKRGPRVHDPSLEQTLWSLRFPNPVGLAAGFDKNAELPHVWGALGFGFAELGTVTARAQSGNPKPRIFRLASQRALINRLGFNNRGAAAIAAQLGGRTAARPAHVPVGINIGKSRDVALEAAADDYLESFRALYRFADYFAINVSSPNTPGLRDLQSPEQLEPLLQALQTENDRLARERRVEKRPLLVKVSPDLSDSEIERLIAAALRCGVAGFIATNTTIARPSLEGVPTANEAGGLSGEPLRARSTSVIRAIRSLTGGSVPIIGVGGIFTAGDAYEKILAGASLVQIYTGFVFEGPNLPRELHRGLRALLQRDGFSNIREAVGRDA